MSSLNPIKYLRGLVEGRKPTVSRAQVLSARPQRNGKIEWEWQARAFTEAEKNKVGRTEPVPVDDHATAEEAEGEQFVLLRIPRRRDRVGNVAAFVFQLPDYRKLELDEIGGTVWEQCDGTRNVEQITKIICDAYHLNRRQGEASVTAYLKMLAERRLIALAPNSAKSDGTDRTKTAGAKQASGQRRQTRRRKRA